MKNLHALLWLLLTLLSPAMLPLAGQCAVPQQVANQLAHLPLLQRPVTQLPASDYLVDPSQMIATVYRTATGMELILDNGLIRRTWRVAPNGACVGFDNLMTGQTLLRSVRPEALLTVNGAAYEVGGLTGQPNHAYLTAAWRNALTANPRAMQLVALSLGKPVERLAWRKVRHGAPDVRWPPAGIYLRMDYELPPPAGDSDADRAEITVSVHYEMYDGVPVISKWLTVHNVSESPITVDKLTVEQLAVVEHSNWVESRVGVALPRPEFLHVETDFAFGGFNHENANRHVVHWRTDPLYSTQVNYLRQSPCLMVVEPTYGPAQTVAAGGTFESFRTFELVYDSADRERRGFAFKRMVRTIAPWVTENPITHHLTNSNPTEVRRAIDQANEVGFEAVIMSFGSGFNMESANREYLQNWKDVADYAERQGVELGSYSLFSSRRIGGGNDIVSPVGQKPTHGNCPAATSKWGLDYYRKLQEFYDFTGFDQFENDGPYPGDVDVTPRPPYQTGEQDSRWAQWRIVTGLYKHLRSLGVYINAPDYYYLAGSNKCGMGYREVNWSLPRAQQVIHTRQNIYDGTWSKTPSMGWMFVPLSQYHGGGAAATTEPLSEHIDHYESLLRSNLGMGVQAHYRGPRIFDNDETREMVQGVVAWFKKYRDILESDFIHGRRADGRDVDWVLHVNPRLTEKGMLCVYNPLDREINRILTVDLYLSGLTKTAQVSREDEETHEHKLSRDYTISLPVSVPAGNMTWFVIR